jgi:hypothetical protein
LVGWEQNVRGLAGELRKVGKGHRARVTIGEELLTQEAQALSLQLMGGYRGHWLGLGAVVAGCRLEG